VTAGGRTDRQPTDGERFERFVREYQDLVFATAVRLLGNAAEAEDVAQTVFLRAFERYAAVAGMGSPAGWLRTVTTNLCLNHITRYRARWLSLGDPGEAPDARARSSLWAPSPLPSPLSALETADRAERIEGALRLLPDHQRVPLVLFHFEEMSYQDIASKLGVSVAKVKTDIHRGRERLRKELSALDEPR